MTTRVAACLCALAALWAGCGGGEDRETGVVLGGTLTVHASLPLRGADAESSRDAVRAHRIALEEARNRVGGLRIRYVPSDSGAASQAGWDPLRTAVIARAAVRDPTTIAYLGERHWEATAVSLPILNEAGILQVSDLSTYAGLTRDDAGVAGEPERYYPSGQRTFARVIPADHVQGAALATMMADEGCTRAFVLDDGLPAGVALADGVRREARAQELALAGRDPIPDDPAGARALAARVVRTEADCVAVAASVPPAGAPPLLRALEVAAPAMPVVASSALAEPALLSELGPAAEAQLLLATPMLGLTAYPPAAQRFLATFRERFGRPAAADTLYAYESMKALLAAIAEAGDLGNDRAEVIRSFFGLQDRESVLGTYDIDDNGDTTLAEYGANRVRGGRLVFDRVVELPEP